MIEETKGYLEQSYECLREAQSLFDENFHKGACNRAYYATFDAIRAILAAQQVDAKSHSGCHSKFRELFIKTTILPKELSEFLTTLFDLRQGGDYELYFQITQ